MEMQAGGWDAPLLSLRQGLIGRRKPRVRLVHKLGPFQVRLERTSNICATPCAGRSTSATAETQGPMAAKAAGPPQHTRRESDGENVLSSRQISTHF
jgi:hypothetical protein